MLIAQRPTARRRAVVDEYRSRFVDRAARARLRLHPRQLPAPHPALVDPRRRRHEHPRRRRPARVHHRARRQGGRHRPHPQHQAARRVSSEHDEPVVMYLRKQGPGAVTAADIAPPAGVEVHNPELHLATLNGKGKLEIELTVERGRGYVSAAQNKQPGQEIGRIPVDSIYSPVLKVTYKVEATRVEQRTDFDRLVVDVETKPSMRPRDAVASRRQDPRRAVRAGPRAQRRRRGHRHGPVARPTRSSPADLALPIEDARPHGAVVQLPQARGHPHRGRARRAQRGRPARHPQLRREVDRRGQGQARHAGPGAQGQPARVRPRLRRRRTSTTTTTTRASPRTSSSESC